MKSIYRMKYVGIIMLFLCICGCNQGQSQTQSGADSSIKKPAAAPTSTQSAPTSAKDVAVTKPKTAVENNTIKDSLLKIPSPGPLTATILSDHPDTICSWFKQLEVWTIQVILVSGEQTISQSDRRLIIGTLATHYTEPRATVIFNEYFQEEKRSGSVVGYRIIPTEFVYLVNDLEKDIQVEVNNLQVRIKGHTYSEERAGEQLDVLLTLEKDSNEFKVSDEKLL